MPDKRVEWPILEIATYPLEEVKTQVFATGRTGITKLDHTLTVCIRHMASPAHNKAIRALLDELNKTQFHHPEAGLRMVYDLV
jgi:arabinogalactan endo-1,4-beta-galactosidase